MDTNTIVAFDKLRQPNSSLPELVEGNTKIGTTRMNAAITNLKNKKYGLPKVQNTSQVLDYLLGVRI
jgi:hypothetical protein